MSGEEGPHWMVPLKFGKRQHLEEFRAGLLYMNSEIYFSKLENDPLRGDRFEGTDYIHQPADVKRIRIEDHNQGKIFEIGPKDLTGPVLISLSQPLIRNIFVCLQ